MGSLGWPEIMLILIVALIIFGPRKLPELGKTLGQSLAQFRKASEDFKRQWEEEVETERHRISTASPSHEPSPYFSEPGEVKPSEPVTVPRNEPAATDTKRDWM